jgi:hypothetical protein
MARADAGDVDQERHAHDFFPYFSSVEVGAVLAEGLSVVTRQEHDRPLRERRRIEHIEHTPDVEVRERDLAVVEVAGRVSELREPRVLEVLIVRVEKVHPEKETILGDPRVLEK